MPGTKWKILRANEIHGKWCELQTRRFWLSVGSFTKAWDLTKTGPARSLGPQIPPLQKTEKLLLPTESFQSTNEITYVKAFLRVFRS